MYVVPFIGLGFSSLYWFSMVFPYQIRCSPDIVLPECSTPGLPGGAGLLAGGCRQRLLRLVSRDGTPGSMGPSRSRASCVEFSAGLEERSQAWSGDHPAVLVRDSPAR